MALLPSEALLKCYLSSRGTSTRALRLRRAQVLMRIDCRSAVRARVSNVMAGSWNFSVAKVDLKASIGQRLQKVHDAKKPAIVIKVGARPARPSWPTTALRVAFSRCVRLVLRQASNRYTIAARSLALNQRHKAASKGTRPLRVCGNFSLDSKGDVSRSTSLREATKATPSLSIGVYVSNISAAPNHQIWYE